MGISFVITFFLVYMGRRRPVNSGNGNLVNAAKCNLRKFSEVCHPIFINGGYTVAVK
jgi:hypothetical protein